MQMGNGETQNRRQVDGTLSMSVAALCAVFVGLTCACFLVVSVSLSVQQHTLRFERAVSDVSVAAMRMFHASNSHHGIGVVAPVASSPDQRSHAQDGAEADASRHHKDLMKAIQSFNRKSKHLRGYFKSASTPPALSWDRLADTPALQKYHKMFELFGRTKPLVRRSRKCLGNKARHACFCA